MKISADSAAVDCRKKEKLIELLKQKPWRRWRAEMGLRCGGEGPAEPIL